MDIKSAEYEAFQDIYQYSSQITGIVMAIHLDDNGKSMLKAFSLLYHFSRNPYLVHIYPNNYGNYSFTAKNAKDIIPNLFELVFVNKGIVKRPEISNNQSYRSSVEMQNCSHTA